MPRIIEPSYDDAFAFEEGGAVSKGSGAGRRPATFGGFGSRTVSLGGGAISDFFAADALRFKAKGARIESEQYALAASLSDRNAQYTQESTAIRQYQLERRAYMTMGQQSADVAASGFGEAGSAIDLMRDSVTQAAL